MAKKLLVSVLKDTLGKYVDGLTDENLQVYHNHIYVYI
jgi:hypothetical protein